MTEVFTCESPFVTLDNRRSRPVLPTTAESLNHRHRQLLPPHLLRGRTVLDLGCCIGATGHWALSLGASSYTGVEHQAEYSRQAQDLLGGSPAVRVLCRDATDFAAERPGRYDIVAMLGVAHGLYDPLALIRDGCAMAEQFVCFEDFGRDEQAPVLLANPSVPMPLAGERAGTRGFGWWFSPAAMELVFRFLGFAPDMRPVFLTDTRWLCRYRRVSEVARSAAYSDVKVPWAP